MDRYVLVVVVNPERKNENSLNGIEAARRLYERIKDISKSESATRSSPFPACSLSGIPGCQKWYFSIQATCGPSQFCSSDWEEVCVRCSDAEEPALSTVDSCSIAFQEEQTEAMSHTELYEEAAEALHQLADKLPPPGRLLLDVIVLGVNEVGWKDFLPVIGSLKHMQAWHSAHITVITQHTAGWQTAALSLSGRVCSPSVLEDCIDDGELWRGGLLIRERKFASELLFEGFKLKTQHRSDWSRVLYPDSEACRYTKHKVQSEVFHYYQPVLELIQFVRVADLPVFIHSSTEFELTLSGKSAKAKLLLDQLRTLRGEIGALFSLCCVVSSEALPPATQLSTSKWRDFVAKNPKVLSAPDVDLKGEKGHYLLLVQGSGDEGCKARLLHSSDQINGSVALAKVNSLIQEKAAPPSGTGTAAWLRSLPCLCGEQLSRREKRLARLQTRVLQECLRRRKEAQMSAAMPLNDLKVLLRLAREQYLKIHDATLPRASTCLPVKNHSSANGNDAKGTLCSDWPERSALRNYENMQKLRQRSRSTLFSTGSSDCLMARKDGQRSGSGLLDAKELLKHFTPDGLPSGELQPLSVLRGENTFQLSAELTPGKVKALPFPQAASAHYHGIEFCLDEQKALERDRAFARLQSRLIRFETQTTCCKEPCPVPLALSPAPAPSPATLSEPGSVPDGESVQGEQSRLKRRSREPESHGHPHKRLSKSESSESLASQCSGGSGTHPAVRALRQQSGRSLSTSGLTRRSAAGPRPEAPREPSPSQKPGEGQTESRSQKHNRMLKEVVAKTLKHHGIGSEHHCFQACSQRLFDISKVYLKDLKTSRGLHEEMKKAAGRNAKQVIDWVVEKASKK